MKFKDLLLKIWIFHFIVSIAGKPLFEISVKTGHEGHWQEVFKNDEHEKAHYSTVPVEDLPIELSSYIGYKVLRVEVPTTDIKRAIFQAKKDNDVEFSVWTRSSTQGFMDIKIDDSNLLKLKERFRLLDYEFNYSVVISDLPQKIFESYPENFKKSELKEASADGNVYEYDITRQIQSTDFKTMNEIFFQDYRPLETINAWLDILQQTFPQEVKIEEIGETYEHRTYKLVHLSMPDPNVPHSDRKTIVITGGVHAREWISISSVLYAIYSSLQLYQNDPQSYYSQLDFIFIPVLNPDGYVHTWEADRLWRKNRQETTFPKCFGIDIDHSYDYHWTRSTDWACGEEYSGEAPFEAFESAIWNQYLNKTNGNHSIYGYIDLHSYSQEVLYPLAYSCSEEPRDEENLVELAYGLAKAIRLQSGKTYNVLPACKDKDSDLLPELGSGTSLDFMYHNKAFWAYQIKLRDSGSHGFLLPGKYIEPVGKEVFAAVRYFCRFLLSDD